jgi:hypothetical protein
MTQITLRRGTAASWTSINPILASGEAGLETDTGKLKFGDGVAQWTALGYFSPNSHTHDASAITSGEFASARIPLANGSDRGGISPGNFAKLQNVEHRQITTPSPTAAPSTYNYGTSYFSIDGQTGWPFAYATVETLRVNGINPRGYQTLVAKDSPATVSSQALTWIRVEYDGDIWSPWIETRVDDAAKAVTFKNSWTNFNATSYENLRSTRSTGDLVALSGMPKPGTISEGVGICTVAPEHRPLKDAYAMCIARTSVPSNIACMVAIRGSGTANPGEVQVFGAPSTTSYLGIGFTYNLGG